LNPGRTAAYSILLLEPDHFLEHFLQPQTQPCDLSIFYPAFRGFWCLMCLNALI
jgi:hypothetical protein